MFEKAILLNNTLDTCKYWEGIMVKQTERGGQGKAIKSTDIGGGGGGGRGGRPKGKGGGRFGGLKGMQAETHGLG